MKTLHSTVVREITILYGRFWFDSKLMTIKSINDIDLTSNSIELDNSILITLLNYETIHNLNIFLIFNINIFMYVVVNSCGEICEVLWKNRNPEWDTVKHCFKENIFVLGFF